MQIFMQLLEENRQKKNEQKKKEYTAKWQNVDKIYHGRIYTPNSFAAKTFPIAIVAIIKLSVHFFYSDTRCEKSMP